VIILLEREREAELVREVHWYEALEAPILAGQCVGRIDVLLDGTLVESQPLIASTTVGRVYVGPPWWLAGILPAGFIVFRYIRWRAEVTRRLERRATRKGT